MRDGIRVNFFEGESGVLFYGHAGVGEGGKGEGRGLDYFEKDKSKIQKKNVRSVNYL